MANIKQALSNKRGESILGYIVVAPFLVYFILYLILGGAYFLKINDMTNIANKKLDRALVEGQFSNGLKMELENELENSGFTGSELEINITPLYAGDGTDGTYTPRGQEIELMIIYKKPHPFYHVNKFFAPRIGESKFYIGTKISGMSEKWW